MTLLNKIVPILCCLLLSCKPMSDSEKIHQTMYETMAAINKNDYLKVVDLIGAPLGTKNDTSGIKHDVACLYYLLTKYHRNKIDSLRWGMDNKRDELSRTKYVIPIFEGFDSITGYQKATLYLYVGPPQMVPFEELSGFECEIQVDEGYRGALIDANKLMDIEDIIDSMKTSK